MSFIAATVPPQLSLSHLARFDAGVEKAFFDIISPNDTPVACSSERIRRALLKAALPSPLGCALTKAVDQARILW